MARTKWRGTAVATAAVWMTTLLAGVAPAAAAPGGPSGAVVVRGPSTTSAAGAVRAAGGSVVRRLELVGGVAARLSPSAAAGPKRTREG